MDPEHLRRQANHLRQLAHAVTDAQVRAAALDLASEYEQEADAIAQGETPDRGGTTAAQSPGSVPRDGT